MIRIVPIRYPAAPFASFRQCAANEGLEMIARLEEEWSSGRLRFDREGEVLFGAMQGNKLAGIAGISLDPYDPQPGLGRVRHLYVRPELRRQGIGGELMRALIAHSRQHFTWLRLRSQPAANSLYERIGFEPYSAVNATHRMIL